MSANMEELTTLLYLLILLISDSIGKGQYDSSTVIG